MHRFYAMGQNLASNQMDLRIARYEGSELAERIEFVERALWRELDFVRWDLELKGVETQRQN